MTFDSCPYCKSERVVVTGDVNARIARCSDCGGHWQPPPRLTEVAEKVDVHGPHDDNWHPAADGEADGGWRDLLDFDE